LAASDASLSNFGADLDAGVSRLLMVAGARLAFGAGFWAGTSDGLAEAVGFLSAACAMGSGADFSAFFWAIAGFAGLAFATGGFEAGVSVFFVAVGSGAVVAVDFVEAFSAGFTVDFPAPASIPCLAISDSDCFAVVFDEADEVGLAVLVFLALFASVFFTMSSPPLEYGWYSDEGVTDRLPDSIHRSLCR
jgi:hypothetical protein